MRLLVFGMRVAPTIRGLLRRRPLTDDRIRALQEAELAKDHLRSVKAGSRSLASSGSQQIDASRRGSL
jgi:hypothetical protein